ncbi:MAG TPA: TonB-dependent receptor [Terracidiphilus sp.]
MREETRRGWGDKSTLDGLKSSIDELAPPFSIARSDYWPGVIFGRSSARHCTDLSGQSSRRRVMSVALICFLISLGSLPPKLYTQTDQKPDQSLVRLSLEELGNVEVTTVSKEPEQVWQTPAAIYVITQEDIRRSGATSIPELLRLAPGVEVARIDSDHWAIGVRGFGGEFSKSLLVLIDGRSVYSPLFAGVYWQVQDTLLEDVDRIEVIRGPGGTIWGANAVNGVINIITKKAKDTHGIISPLGGGDVDQGIGGLRFGGMNNKGFDYRIYGKGFIRAPEFHPDGMNFDGWKMGQLGFRIDWSKNTRDTLNVQGDIYKGLDGERVAVSFYSPPSVSVLDGPHHTSGGNITGGWRRQLGATSDVEARGYFDRTSRFSPQLDETRNTYDLDLLYHLLTKSRQDLLLGVGARWSHDHVTQIFQTLNFTASQETDSIYSWFIQDQIGIVPTKVSLIVGSKFEHNNRSGFEIQPNGRLMWTPTSRQTVWAAVTRAVRTPSRLDQDLQLTDFLEASPPVFLRVVGSKNFRSEHLLGTEVGYRSLIAHQLYADLSIYRNEYNDLYGYGPGSDYVEFTPPPAHIILQEPLANALKGDAAGGEIELVWKPVNWVEVKGSYSYLHLYVHDKPGFTDDQNTVSDNGSSPHHQTVIQAQLNIPKGFELDPTFRHVSSLPAEKVTAYSTGDIRFGWHAKRNWEIAVVGRNLMQPHHSEFGSDVDTIVGIKREAYAKIMWTK